MNNSTAVTQSVGLSALSSVALDVAHMKFWQAAKGRCGGPAIWFHRKLAEFRDLLVLSQLSGRILIQYFDLSAALRVLFVLKVPVGCLPKADGPLEVAPMAQLGLTYREEALRLPQPGTSFIQILSPNHVWHANVASDSVQPLCLGARLPAGIPVKELVLMTYGALTMQSVQLDAWDPAGVLNREAAQWWLQNRSRIPLSREPFLAETEPTSIR